MVDRLASSEANAKRIAFIEYCFGSAGQSLSVPNRVLVGEGILTKMCRKKAKPRQFFLFNDILVYGNIILNKKKMVYNMCKMSGNHECMADDMYNKQHIIPLENVHLQPVENDEGYENGWQIISPSKSFTVYAATQMEKSDWMAHINKCIRELRSKRGSHNIVESSPVWIPDVEAPVCMHCRKSEFTVVNRRHHCRKCGIVCCNSCSNKKWLLPHQSTKPVRVCNSCYDKLTINDLQKSLPGTGTTAPTSDSDSCDDLDQGTISHEPTFYSSSN